MSSVFLEVILTVADLAAAGFDGRDELEDTVQQALESNGLGEVTGGGSGEGVTNIDVELNDEASLEEGIAVIRTTLQWLKAPRSTFIQRHSPNVVFPLYP